MLAGWVFAAFAALTLWRWSPSSRIYRVHPELKADAPGAFTDIGGVSTHYALRGSGPLIVFVHGWSGCSEDFYRVMDDLSETNTVLAYDHYGHGYTDGVSANSDMRSLVALLSQLLIKLAPLTSNQTLQPFTLIGFSMGGPISAGFALEFPHMVKKLVLINPAGIRVPMPLEGHIVKLPLLGDTLFQLAGRSLLEMQVSKGFVDGEAMEPAVKARKIGAIRSRMQHHPGHAKCLLSMLRHFRPLFDFEDGFAQLQNQSFPVMAILGENDAVCRFEGSKEKLRQLIPRAKVHTIGNCGHEDTLVKHSKEVALVIAAFANDADNSNSTTADR
uniref:AB hydrolase-1 domain-containing protein n=1 Tax=Lotharella oceanica TaxID=641309 RepID=A0A7S2TPD5_9EUKA|mmetsp:Transcript_21112/g.39622  ORF Transcript_21112/g.39622 Transcript_21112/m.39622 type:complete len:330 (+) Transcript_21112:63-1052(+)